MLVQCPSCRTTYRVSEEVITAAHPTFRCSRCKHIFVLGLRPEPSPTPEPDPASPSVPMEKKEDKERELSFSFPPADKEMVEQNLAPPARDPFPVPEEKPGSWTDSPTGTDPQFVAASQFEPSPEASPQFETADQVETAPQLEATPQFEAEWPASSPRVEQAETAPAVETEGDHPVSILPYFSLFGALLLLYCMIALLHWGKSALVETFLKGIPWVGSSVFKNNHLRQAIILQSLRPAVQKIQGNREVFMLSGVAVNRNSVGVREVRVEGRIYGADGKEIENQTITIGNAISPKLMKDLTAQDISILQSLSPQKRFEILPEGSTTFVIVFLKASRGTKDFSCRVLSAEESEGNRRAKSET